MSRVIGGVSIDLNAFDEEAPELPLRGRKLEEAVDEDIALFDRFFQELGNDPLSGPERSIIKTYVGYKTGAYSDKQKETEGAEDAS